MTTQPLNDITASALIKLGAATLYEAQGATGAVDCAIKPLSPTMKMAGRAFTLHLRPGDNLMIHYALLHVSPGDVLIINCDGFTEAGIWGDVLTTQAQYAGLAGLIVNGAVRDSEAIIQADFPVFARAISIRGTEKKQPGVMNQPVNIGDCTIYPRDIIVGDRDGIVVIPARRLEEVMELACAREEKEANYKNKIAKGATTAELMNLHAVFDALNLK